MKTYLKATLGVAAVLLLSVAAQATPDALRLDFDAELWKSVTPPGKRDAEFMIGRDGGVMVRAKSAVSFLYRDIKGLPVVPQRLSWRWRVDWREAAGERSVPGRDDRPLALHVWFPKPAAERSVFDDLQTVMGFPVVGHALTYVWGGTAERGRMFDNPHLEDGKLIVLRNTSAPRRLWLEESVDLAADFERAFGRPLAEKPRFVAISSDTDDLGGLAIAKVADLRFAPARQAAR